MCHTSGLMVNELLVHECQEPLCHKIIPMDKQYCPVHAQQHYEQWQRVKEQRHKSRLAEAIKRQDSKVYDYAQRDPAAKAFYGSKSWQQVRDYVYARDRATCQVCGNVVTDRKIVDHIVPRRLLSRNEALDTANLWTLCYRCHSRKTKLEEIISAKQNGDTKLKHLGRQWWTKVLNEKKPAS